MTLFNAHKVKTHSDPITTLQLCTPNLEHEIWLCQTSSSLHLKRVLKHRRGFVKHQRWFLRPPLPQGHRPLRSGDHHACDWRHEGAFLCCCLVCEVEDIYMVYAWFTKNLHRSERGCKRVYDSGVRKVLRLFPFGRPGVLYNRL